MIDLEAQRRRLEPAMSKAIQRVLEHGQFIMGPEVSELEHRLCTYTGAGFVVTCGNGTDALELVLMAENIGPGDAVIVPSFTFVATAEAVALRGATPVFADVHESTFNIDVLSAERAVRNARELGLRPRMMIAVDLFGLPADYRALRELAARHGLCLVADAAQSFGATLGEQRVGTLADYTTTSFFPSKPLGCYGDGGAVLTDDEHRAEVLRSLRVHGKGDDKYDNIRVGLNSRLDTMQAAVLLEKMAILDDEIAAREALAETYDEQLANCVRTPWRPKDVTSAWAQYTICCDSSEHRIAVQRSCTTASIGTAVYYPRALHQQRGYRSFPADPAGLASSDRLSAVVLSLPMHPYLSPSAIDAVVTGVSNSR